MYVPAYLLPQICYNIYVHTVETNLYVTYISSKQKKNAMTSDRHMQQYDFRFSFSHTIPFFLFKLIWGITTPTSRRCELIYKVMFATQPKHPSITQQYNDGVVEYGFYGIWFMY